VLIVTYHALGEPRSPVSVPLAQLASDLAALVDAGFAFVSLDQCADWLAGRTRLPERPVAVTFDDGYAGLARDGLPILSRLGVPATVFVIAGRVGRDNRWPGQGRGVRPMPLADWQELGALVASGLTLGSHSMSHPALPSLRDAALAEEVVASADHLEQMIQAPVRHFSYPYGRRGAREMAAASQRYRTAVTAVSRIVDRTANPHDLGRIDAHDLHLAVRLRLLGRWPLPRYLAIRRHGRRARRLVERVTGAGREGAW